MKRKDEIRDIYRGTNVDIEKEFTPQVAHELVESRKRDLRRSRLFSLSAGVFAIMLAIALLTVILHDFLSEKRPSQKVATQERPFVPRYTLPADSLWVMDYQMALSQVEDNASPGPKPLSTQWIKNAAYHIIMGQQSLAVNEPDEAMKHFQKVVEIYPDIQGLHRAMGQLYLQKEDYAQAAVHLEKALKEEETFEVFNNLGTAYLGTEEYDKAERSLLRALELRPETPACYKNLAVLYRKTEQTDKAVYYFEKYIDLQPSDLATMQAYAFYLTKLGRWKEAADFLTKLSQEVTDVAPVYFLLAQVQVQNGKQDKALEALKRGIQLVDPELALAWMSREEFNSVRETGGFKDLVDRLEISSVSLKKDQ